MKLYLKYVIDRVYAVAMTCINALARLVGRIYSSINGVAKRIGSIYNEYMPVIKSFIYRVYAVLITCMNALAWLAGRIYSSIKGVAKKIGSIYNEYMPVIKSFIYKVYIYLYPYWPFSFKHEHLTIRRGAVIDFDYASIETWPYKLIIPEGVISIEGDFSRFKYGGNEFSMEGTKLSKLWEENGDDLCVNMVCPSTLVKISDNALVNSIKFKDIRLNEGLKFIGTKAFAACAVDSIKLPSTVEEVGSYAFYKCWAKSVELNHGLKRIGSCAFYYAENIQSLVLPCTLQKIDAHDRNLYPLSYDLSNLKVVCKAKLYQKVRHLFFTNTPFLRSEFSQYTEVENRSYARLILEYVIESISHSAQRCIGRSQYLSLIRRFTPEKRQLIENLGEICAMRELPAELGVMIIEHCGTPSRYRDEHKLIDQGLRIKFSSSEEELKEWHENTYNSRQKEIKAENAVI